MKTGYLLIIILFISVALGLGWFFEKQPAEERISDLEVPDNIDYYLSNLKYRSMNEQGSVKYFLQSPLLEHYIKQDISQLQQPDMKLNGDRAQWLISSDSGKLQHANELFELKDRVRLTKKSQLQPMLLTTSLMILKPQQSLIQIPRLMNVTTSNVKFQAASAVLRIDRNQHSFKRVNATYHSGNLKRSSNEKS